jgi:hypothetical protein
VKLVMTLLVRDEADIVDANIAFHLGAGVDFVVATDNRSVDGTTEILESYVRDGVLHLIREPGEAYLQAEWVTRMARLAAREHGADWVINSDADEFWWPRGESLKDVLECVPQRYGVVRGLWRHFVPRPGEGPFYERMTVRLRPGVALTSPLGSYATEAKTTHRADSEITDLGKGKYATPGGTLFPVRGWYPMEVLHFPMRSEAQTDRKYRNLAEAIGAMGRGPMPLHELALGQGEQSFYASQVVDEERSSRGRENGSLVLDTRLRDALRELLAKGGEHPFALSSGSERRLHFTRPDIVDELEYGTETVLLDDADVIRFQSRLDRLEAELNNLRLTRRAKLRWKLAQLRRR